MSPDRSPADDLVAVTHACRTRALVVGGVRLLREGIVLALSRYDAIEVVGATDATLEAVLRGLATRPDVVLLDMGSAHAVSLARQITERSPETKLVALAVSEVEDNLVAYAEARICGFVSSDGSVDDVVAAITHALRGEVLCSPRLAASMLRRLVRGSGAAHTHSATSLLTKREQEIVALVDQGLSNKEIGARLRIGTATVKNHIHHILEKLQVQRRGQAAAWLRSMHSYVAETQPPLQRDLR